MIEEPKETAGARPGLVARVAPGLAAIRSQGRRSLRTDSIAALSLWAVLVPQALAYADLAGLAPALGLYTAFAGMIAYAIFGTSRYLNVGPESSVAIVIAASLTPLAAEDPDRYAALAAVLALMVGGFLLLGYLVRAGVVTRLLSAPVLAGYLAGAAFVIISNQLPKLFDIKLEGTTTFPIVELDPELDRANWTAFTIGLGAAALMLGLLRQGRCVPGRRPASGARGEVPVRMFVVNAEAIYDVDTTGVRMLSRLLDDLEPSGVRFAMARVRTSVRDMLRRTGLEERIGPDGFYLTVVEATNAFDADRPTDAGMEP